MQPKRLGHIFGMSPGLDLFDRANPQHLKRLVIKLPALVVPHTMILPDHATRADLLMNFLVTKSF